MRGSLVFVFGLNFLFITSGCKDAPDCTNVAQGTYHGWFTKHGASSSFYSRLYISHRSVDSMAIGPYGIEPAPYWTVHREECSIEGGMQVIWATSVVTLMIMGQIIQSNNEEVIIGDYFQKTVSDGLGNQNNTVYQDSGTFIIAPDI
jgi:hypothetical protein